LALVQQHNTIYHEDLHTANMLRNHHRATSIDDAGWAAFLSILTYKAACAAACAAACVGRRVVGAPPAYTSLYQPTPARSVLAVG
jgi:hypothetical protein